MAIGIGYGEDGSPIPGGPQLALNPETLDFGEVTQAQTRDLDIEVTNIGDFVCTIDSIITSNGDFTIIASPNSINPETTEIVTIRYTAGAPGASSGSITIQSNAINSPTGVIVQGTSVAAGTVAFSLDPPLWEFPVTKVGVASDIKVFTILNTGTVNITINNVVIDAPFAAAAPTPAYPAVILPGATLDFGVRVTPVAAGYILDTSGIHITSTAPTSPDVFQLAVQAVLITPAYTVNLGEGFTAVAFTDDVTPTIEQFDSEDLDCEEAAIARRWFDFGRPGGSANYYQCGILYEDKGTAEIEVTVRNHSASNSDTVAIGDNGSEDILTAYAQALPTYDPQGTMEFRIDRGADDGPVSIVEIIHVFESDATRLGSSSVPASITPVFTVDADNLPLTICGFSDFSVKQFDPEDLDCEEQASATRDRNLTMPGYQSSATRVQVNYENKGVASLTVTVVNRYGQTSTQTNSLGSAGADESIQQKLFDLAIEDEVLTFALSRAADAGPISLTGHNVRYVDRGEVKK